MYAPASSAYLPARVVFLSAREQGVRTDTRTLRSLGVRGIRHIASGQEFLKELEQAPTQESTTIRETGVVEALVCDERLEDMSALVFLRSLAAMPSRRNMPVVVLTSSPEACENYRSTGVQCLVRPYAEEDLAEALNRALSPMRCPLRKDVLDALVGESASERKEKKPHGEKSAVETTTDLFNRGLEALRKNAPKNAEAAFLEVLKRREDHVEACIGMARIHRSRGEMAEMQRFLLRAAAASLRQGDKTRAGSICNLLPEHMRGGAIFIYEAIARMEEGEYRAAALSFLDVCREYPNMRLHAVLARGCQFTQRPEESIKKLCNAYESMGHDVTAKKLRQRLLYSRETSYEEGSSWLDRFPRLKEVVSVASVTAWAWKQA